MERRTLLTYPDSTLKEKTRPVDDPQKWHSLIDEMKRIIREHHGMGLAAPQVGEPVSIFLLCLDADKQLYEAYINPEILNQSQWEAIPEGCLSFPDVTVEIERALRVDFRALTPAGKTVERTVEGIQAQCVQHEVDHLRGRTLVDHCDIQQKMQIHSELQQDSSAS